MAEEFLINPTFKRSVLRIEWILRLSLQLCLLSPTQVFSAEIVLPSKPKAEESAAAAELARIWQLAAAEPATPIIRFYIGDTTLSLTQAPVPPGTDADGFRVLALTDGTIFLHGATPLATRFAVNWFCAYALNARWFMPGELGEIVPQRKWIPCRIDALIQPGFLSRSFIGLDEAGREWALRNSLHDRWPNGHALFHVIPPTLYGNHPEWFPLLEGQRYRPTGPSDYNWQPNIADPEVANEAADYVTAYFRARPDSEGVSLSINDSIRYDQSGATLSARGPLRWFRGRPDYSNLVFSFMNRVADKTAKVLSEKHLSAYAYYWCENTPDFPVRPSVFPWLTADRTQWYDLLFAEEDQSLIRRWCRSGASIVGCYDYLYGAPFVVPRVTTRLTAESLRFEYKSGVRAFTAETNPNWAFDGPKLWVAGQLLWNPQRSVEALLKEYYRSFFGKAASEMENFYELCETAWQSQPGSARWIRYYQDQDQAQLFPPAHRLLLRRALDRAKAVAHDSTTIRRIAFVRAAYDAADAFCAFNESRVALSNATASMDFQQAGKIGTLATLLSSFQETRRRFESSYSTAVADQALCPTDISVYFRDDPSLKAKFLLDSTTQSASSATLGTSWLPVAVRDPFWIQLCAPKRLDDTTFIWNLGPWQGRGEPAQHRSIQVLTTSDKRSVLFKHTANEQLAQWIPATPGKLYRIESLFRGTVSQSNEEYIMINWLDSASSYTGNPAEDRVPPGEWLAPRRLAILARAPTSAAKLGIAIYSFHQSSGDSAEFTAPQITVSVN